MRTPALLVEGLTKTYRPGDTPAVDGLSFTGRRKLILRDPASGTIVDRII